MKRIFLTSSAHKVARNIARDIGNARGMKLALINTPIEFNIREADFLDKYKVAFKKEGFVISDYTISSKSSGQIKEDLLGYDVIFVSGGNPFYMLQKIQETHSAKVLRDLIEKEGKIYIGSSAGAIVAGPNIYCSYRPDLEREYEGFKLSNYTGLGLVDFIVFPHWGDDEVKKTYFDFRLSHYFTEKNKIILLTNYQYIKVEGNTYKIIDVKN